MDYRDTLTEGATRDLRDQWSRKAREAASYAEEYRAQIVELERKLESLDNAKAEG